MSAPSPDLRGAALITIALASTTFGLIEMGNGVRMRQPTKTEAAQHRRQKAQNAAMQRRIEADTCGLGRWEQPEGWDYPTFSHTVTPWCW